MPYTQFIDRLVITSTSRTNSSGIAILGNQICNCTLGRSAINTKIREGSGATPAGVWHMQLVLYRPDRIRKPTTGIECFEITENDSWCDNPCSPHYNLPLGNIPENTDEVLWRQDRLYDLVVVLDHNSQPAVRNLGSAIFMHTSKKENRFTLGCIAFKQADLIRIISFCDSRTKLIVKN